MGVRCGYTVHMTSHMGTSFLGLSGERCGKSGLDRAGTVRRTTALVRDPVDGHTALPSFFAGGAFLAVQCPQVLPKACGVLVDLCARHG